MAYVSPLDNTLALNPQATDSLRMLASHGNSREGMKAASNQFEAYFLQLMMRSMRETLSQDGPFDSQETRTFTDMFDQQVAQKVSQSKGLGLADIMVAQLGQLTPPVADKAISVQKTSAVNFGVDDKSDVPPVANASSSASSNDATGNFVDRLWPHAVEAARTLGVSPHFLVAHAALETGWGKHELKAADGTASNNLFNIKAGSNWDGKTVQKAVTEYVNGKPVTALEKFRAYDTASEAFSDYTKLLSSNPRYAGVLNQDAEGFARGLQQGGFATDPAYAVKLRRIIGGSSLRLGLAG
jgi:flagellar protein FlgJ